MAQGSRLWPAGNDDSIISGRCSINSLWHLVAVQSLKFFTSDELASDNGRSKCSNMIFSGIWELCLAGLYGLWRHITVDIHALEKVNERLQATNHQYIKKKMPKPEGFLDSEDFHLLQQEYRKIWGSRPRYKYKKLKFPLGRLAALRSHSCLERYGNLRFRIINLQPQILLGSLPLKTKHSSVLVLKGYCFLLTWRCYRSLYLAKPNIPHTTCIASPVNHQANNLGASLRRISSKCVGNEGVEGHSEHLLPRTRRI